MLWIDAREAREGGVRLRTLQTPLLFLLELLVIPGVEESRKR